MNDWFTGVAAPYVTERRDYCVGVALQSCIYGYFCSRC